RSFNGLFLSESDAIRVSSRRKRSSIKMVKKVSSHRVKFFVAVTLAILGCGVSSWVANADVAPVTYPSLYSGTDSKVIPPAPALGPANSVLTDPTFGSRILRVTDQNTRAGESFISTQSGFQRSFNANSTAIKLTGPGGDGYWLEFNPTTFKVGDGTAKTTPHPVSFGSNWEWSAVNPSSNQIDRKSTRLNSSH